MTLRTILLIVAAISPLVSAQSSTATSSTCAPAVPLQTTWQYELPSKNPGKNFGPPHVPQGKSWQGQPKKVKKTKGKKIRNVGCVTMLSSKYILISIFRVRDFLRSTHLVTDFGTIVIITIPDGFGPASEVSSQFKLTCPKLTRKIGLSSQLPPMEEFRGRVERSSLWGTIMTIRD